MYRAGAPPAGEMGAVISDPGQRLDETKTHKRQNMIQNVGCYLKYL